MDDFNLQKQVMRDKRRSRVLGLTYAAWDLEPSAKHVGYIMEDLPIAPRDDKKAHEEYRTKRLLLEVYDVIFGATPWQACQVGLTPLLADPWVVYPDGRSTKKEKA